MDERVPGWMADQIEVDMVPRLNEVLRADVAARAEGGCVELRHPSPVGVRMFEAVGTGVALRSPDRYARPGLGDADLGSQHRLGGPPDTADGTP